MKIKKIEHSRADWLKRLGSIEQAAYVHKCVSDDGPSRGMRIWEVNNGGGLTFTVLPDRCLDIAACSYDGVPLAFVSRIGMMHPHRYGDDQILRSFTGGLLTTCGATYMGAACTDLGEELGLHGRIHSTAADETYAGGRWDGDEYLLEMRGMMREAKLFGENIRLRREIISAAGSASMTIRDAVTNEGFFETPLMLLYHFNFGYPMLGEHTRLAVGETLAQTLPRDGEAAAALSDCSRFDAPVHGFREQVFYHFPKPDANGFAKVSLLNIKLGLAAYVRYHTQNLPILNEWKQTGEGDYVCGLEPATWRPEGRDKARAAGDLRMIAPGETVNFELEVGTEYIG
ncbi:MAG: aldose 1-epimerase family protein [Defluviitaleaceae bacterium]|nr:aldose 1-epimerase family protein [Defluviitaleaceae bacterium]